MLIAFLPSSSGLVSDNILGDFLIKTDQHLEIFSWEFLLAVK